MRRTQPTLLLGLLRYAVNGTSWPALQRGRLRRALHGRPGRNARERHDLGETLHHYAAWSGIPADVIAEESGLTPDAPLLPGQLVLLYVDVETEETVLRRKAALSAARQARFLTERPIVTTLRHEVRAGETAWKLARGAGVPLWLLGHLNPGVELDRLRAGTTLTIPVLDELQAVLLDDADEEPGC